MKFYFHGAVRNVTGSRHIIETDGKRLLLDCGMVQGKRKVANERNRAFLFDPKSIDAVVLSHAHIDHSGSLPVLVREGFEGPIFTHSATVDLCEILLRDSAYIQEQDAHYLNKRLRKKGKPLIEPVYTQEDADAVMPRFRRVGYEESFEPLPGVRAVLRDAGHILGSATVTLELEGTRVIFSGDLGRPGMPILRDPQPLPEADYLITETTYGDRLHESSADMKNRLEKIIEKAVKRGGRVVIPAFSVGRTQNLIYFLNELVESGELKRLPVFVDSPLAINATEICRKHPECFDGETLSLLEGGDDPLAFRGLKYTRSVKESKAINEVEGSSVVISASGMCEAGRILHHLKNTVSERRNTICIVGFQAEHTLGRRIVEGKRDVRIFGDLYPLSAMVETMNGFSAHADYREMLDFYEPLRERLRGVFLVHGDLGQCVTFAHKLQEKGYKDVLVPEEEIAYEVEPANGGVIGAPSVFSAPESNGSSEGGGSSGRGALLISIILIICAITVGAIGFAFSRKPERGTEIPVKETEKSLTELLEYGRGRYKEGDIGRGAKAFGEAAALDSKARELIDALIDMGKRGIGEANTGNLYKAAVLDSLVGLEIGQRILQAIETDMPEPEAKKLRIAAYHAFTRALELNKGWSSENQARELMLEIPRIAHELKRYEVELKHLADAAVHFGSQSFLHFSIGLAKMNLFKYREAAGDFKKAIALNSDWGTGSQAHGLINLGICYLRLENYAVARDTAGRALVVEPMNTMAAQIWFAANEKLPKLEREYFPPVLVAWKHLRKGRIEKAAKEFGRAAALLPGSSVVVDLLAVALAYKTVDDNAAEILTRLGTANPLTAQRTARRLVGYAKLERNPERKRLYRERASIVFDHALTGAGSMNERNRAELLVDAAENSWKLDRKSKARDLLVRAAAMDYFGNISYVHARLGMVELVIGNASEAVMHLERAIEIGNQWGQFRRAEPAYLLLGEANEKLKRNLKARETYGDAVKLFPGSEKAKQGWHRANNALAPKLRKKPPWED
ncbi:MAG: MBL fold metallo-hydrolase [Planctomycetota bacterium]|nr:MAG: MBL fold metallo-hydrolase [Planctomycetota bacterium]